MSWLRTPKILTSSSFRFAMLTVGVIWLSTALVLVAVYMQLDRAIWRSIDASLDLQTTELLQITMLILLMPLIAIQKLLP